MGTFGALVRGFWGKVNGKSFAIDKNEETKKKIGAALDGTSIWSIPNSQFAPGTVSMGYTGVTNTWGPTSISALSIPCVVCGNGVDDTYAIANKPDLCDTCDIRLNVLLVKMILKDEAARHPEVHCNKCEYHIKACKCPDNVAISNVSS